MHQNLTHPFSHKIELLPHLRITAKSQGTPDKITSAPQNGEIACRAFRDFVSLAERKQQLCCSQRCDFPRKNRPPIGCCRAPHPGHLQTLIFCVEFGNLIFTGSIPAPGAQARQAPIQVGDPVRFWCAGRPPPFPSRPAPKVPRPAKKVRSWHSWGRSRAAAGPKSTATGPKSTATGSKSRAVFGPIFGSHVFLARFLADRAVESWQESEGFGECFLLSPKKLDCQIPRKKYLKPPPLAE